MVTCEMSGARKCYIRVYLIFTILLLLSLVLGSGFGTCPKYPPLPGFDMKKITGRWFEVERSFYLMELSASCTTLDVALGERNSFYINVTTVNRFTGMPTTTYGIGIPSSEGSSIFRYKLNNRLPYAISRLLPGAGMYNIVFTDYDHYAVIWSCSSITFAYADHIWLLGRKRDFPAEQRAQIYHIMEELELDPDRLIVSKNIDCPAQTS